MQVNKEPLYGFALTPVQTGSFTSPHPTLPLYLPSLSFLSSFSPLLHSPSPLLLPSLPLCLSSLPPLSSPLSCLPPLPSPVSSPPPVSYPPPVPSPLLSPSSLPSPVSLPPLLSPPPSCLPSPSPLLSPSLYSPVSLPSPPLPSPLSSPLLCTWLLCSGERGSSKERVTSPTVDIISPNRQDCTNSLLQRLPDTLSATAASATVYYVPQDSEEVSIASCTLSPKLLTAHLADPTMLTVIPATNYIAAWVYTRNPQPIPLSGFHTPPSQGSHGEV